MKPEQGGARRSLTFVTVGAIRVAIPTPRIGSIAEIAEADEADRIDLGAALGSPLEPSLERRRALVLADRAPYVLIADVPITVAEVEPGDVHPFPDYVAAWAARRGIGALVSGDERLRFLIDVDTLVDLHLAGAA